MERSCSRLLLFFRELENRIEITVKGDNRTERLALLAPETVEQSCLPVPQQFRHLRVGKGLSGYLAEDRKSAVRIVAAERAEKRNNCVISPLIRRINCFPHQMAEICFTADLVVAPGGIPGAFSKYPKELVD